MLPSKLSWRRRSPRGGGLAVALLVTVCCGEEASAPPPVDAGSGVDAALDAAADAPRDAASDVGADVGTGADAADAVADAADAAADAADAAPPPIACTVVASSLADLSRALAAPAPGSTVCLADGTYADANLVFTAPGTAAQPIVITAQNPGRAILTGQTQISMGGAFATLQGFVIQGGQSLGGSLIELKNGRTSCDGCRVTEVAILDVDAGNPNDTKWVSLYGQRNRVDHCAFSGKTSQGTVLVVWRSSARTDDHRIDHNLFANRPAIGSNGNEAIRVGTGAEASSDSRTIIEENLFEAMNGDAEFISIKSGANTVRHNTIRRSKGTLTLRNGAGSTVDANIILTEGVADAGGIRVIGPRHRVTNNYVEGVRSTSSARGALSLVAGKLDPGPGEYAPVRDALVAFNTIVDCEQSLILGAVLDPQSTLAPENVTLANNLVSAARGSVAAPGAGLTTPSVFGNFYFGAPLGFSPAAGFTEIDARLTRAPGGLMRPSAGSPAVDAASGAAAVTADIDGQARSGAFDVGCDEVGAPGPVRGPLGRADVGPTRWRVTVP